MVFLQVKGSGCKSHTVPAAVSHTEFFRLRLGSVSLMQLVVRLVHWEGAGENQASEADKSEDLPANKSLGVRG